MKLWFFFLSLSLSLYVNAQCGSALDKKAFAVPTIFNFLRQPAMDFCKPMKVGQKINFDVDSIDSPTTVAHTYQLERISDKEYKIRFNINFVDGDNQRSNSTRSKAYTYVWRKLANECLAKVHNKIKGPNGENLVLELEENNPKSKIPKIKVKLKEEGRANSREWIKKMPCSTILHELLHVTGLVDEYHEQQVGIVIDPATGKNKRVKTGAEKLAYDCRKIGDKHSIMHTQDEKWRRVFGTWKKEMSLCECGSEKNKCETYFKELQKKMQPYISKTTGEVLELPDELKQFPAACPEGFIVYPKYAKTDILTEEEKGTVAFGGGLDLPNELPADFWNDKVVIQRFSPNVEADRESILDERQWNAIIYPGCFSKNTKYYEDAINAYRTSRENGGRGCVSFSQQD